MAAFNGELLVFNISARGWSHDRRGTQAAADEMDLLERQVSVEPADDVYASVSGI